jgi:hypothetical protein
VRALLLRGVDVDLCFHCGALWLDHGELARLSAGRHPEPPRADDDHALVAAPPPRPDGTVRLDVRSPRRAEIGVLAYGVALTVILGVAMHALPRTPTVALWAIVPLLFGGALRRRSVVDVFPRAGRLLRSRAWMPTDVRDPRAERLDEAAHVVLRPWGTRMQADYVDGLGRVLAPLGRGPPGRVRRQAGELARRLGAAVVVHPFFGGVWPATTFARRWTRFELGRVRGARHEVAFTAGAVDGALFTVRNSVPAQGTEDEAARRALCFFLEDGQGHVLRLHDDGYGHTVVVDGAAEPVAVVDRRDGRRGTTRCALSGHAIRVRLTPRLPFLPRVLLDDRSRVVGWMMVADGDVRVGLAEDIDDAERLCALLLVVDSAVGEDFGLLAPARR